jgi:Domain of unknown function (DUF4388)
MSLIVVAEPDLRERLRCIRIVADQAQASAVGAANWLELTQVLEDAPGIGLVLYAACLVDAPEDAVPRLLERSRRLVLAGTEGEGTSEDGVTRVPRPIAEETLVMLARSVAATSTPPHASFVPVDFLQMLCMSGGSHVLVLSQQGREVGIIEVRDGEVWTAFDAAGVGEEAFARLIRPEMRARLSTRPASQKERSIFRSLNELVLDSLRLMDEGHVGEAQSLSAAQFELAFSTKEELAERVQRLNDEARKQLVKRDYDEAVRTLSLLAELDPSSHLVRANLEQLRRLGFPR